MFGAAQLERIREHEAQRRLSAALFGELLNLQRHSSVSARLLPDVARGADALLALRKSQYLSLAFFKENISRLGFLKDAEIKELMQLSLKVRNDDIHLSWAIEQVQQGDEVQLQEIRKRLQNTAARAEALLKALAGNNRRLRRLATDDESLAP
jgi:hypothetical protein